MLDSVQAGNGVTNHSTSMSQEIGGDIQKALALMDMVKKQNSKMTVKQLVDLLIEYIIANMRGDANSAGIIQNQIVQAIQTYAKDMQMGNALMEKLKAMAGSSKESSKDLTYLQNLIQALTQDVDSGDMSNLDPFLSPTHPKSY